MDKIQRVEKYIYEFFTNRFEHYDMFYRSTHRDRTYGVYKLNDGPKVMDLIMSIHGNIEDQFYFEKLIPHKFTTPEALFSSLNSFKEFLIQNEYLIIQNLDGENTYYVVSELLKIKTELIQMIDYAKQLYDFEDNVIPYQDLRYYLINKDINNFIKTLKSILSSVSYAIAKTKEGYHHSNIHLILKLLGFEIISEEITNVGRIDAVIRFIDTIYILEFKFGGDEDLSKEALKQIKEKGYPEKFFVEKKEILAIGISFSEADRNINGFEVEKTN
jgi:hypothetical protein